MAGACFNDYKALSKYISELPSPKSGHLRVFRGQCKDYGNIRPTGVRIPLRNDHVWRRYCRMVATDMLVQRGTEVETALSNSDLWAYWYYAIVQHYGPGTHLLDVTHSLGVALWFALHQAATGRRIKLRYVSSGPTSYGPALYRQDEWTSYHEWKESPGVIYVFDVPGWVPPELPGHGTLVDLARAPEAFTTSARIQAQKACLIAADAQDPSGGDLTSFLACPPVKVEWPMDGCQAVNLPEAALFPSPYDDEWYARLLFLPVVHQMWHEEPYWRMAHPVQLSLYVEHLVPSMYAVQFKPLQPPLLYPWLVAPALVAEPPDEVSYQRAARFLRTVPILLEAPVLALQPEHDDETWDHAQLVSNLPTVLGVIDWQSDDISDRELLTDVLFELSPLEVVGWTDVLRAGGEMLVPRAVHLAREDEFAWRLQVFFQLAPREQVSVLFEEAAAIRFDQPSGRLQIKDADAWKDISTNPIAAKSLFVALTLLRALSPDLQARTSFAAAVRTVRPVLKRAPDIGLGIRYFVMRDSGTNDPYTGEKT